MKVTDYRPAPVDTSDIELSPELMALSEVLARNVHDLWAEARSKDGWSYGEVRDDDRKTHPGLVPYENLSESEKDYDRNTSIQTLKLILKLGFVIRS